MNRTRRFIKKNFDVEHNDFNKTHPELLDGEVFWLNTIGTQFADIEWKTKREGKQSYAVNGLALKGCNPVFVQKQELLDAGLTV